MQKKVMMREKSDEQWITASAQASAFHAGIVLHLGHHNYHHLLPLLLFVCWYPVIGLVCFFKAGALKICSEFVFRFCQFSTKNIGYIKKIENSMRMLTKLQVARL